MNKLLKTLMAAGLFAVFSVNALAADVPPTMQERMQKMQSMTPEQRAVEREAMHKEMQSLTPGTACRAT